jgi:fructose-bisphosphate aldolase class I
MDTSHMAATAIELVAPGKGILALDESGSTIGKRFAALGIANTAENRRDYREGLITTRGLNAYISGVIFNEETVRQSTRNGQPLLEVTKSYGLMPGVKVDRGPVEYGSGSKESVTEGLDGLRARLEEFHSLGLRFTKWRAVFRVGKKMPSHGCLRLNIDGLVRSAMLSQEAGLVPIVEPEVLIEGEHGIERHFQTTTEVLDALFFELRAQHGHLEAALLKANMILPGALYLQREPAVTIARETLRCMRRVVPPAIPGIVFLSGGQSELEATDHLDALNRLNESPWQLSFSFGRALQDTAMKAWQGCSWKMVHAQVELLRRARCNSAARFGRYRSEMEGQAS